jgi:carboxypeptidase family protein
MAKRLIGIGLAVLVYACASGGDTIVTQAVSGVVVSSDGSTPSNVVVQAVPVGGIGTAGTRTWVSTDKQGRFEILLKPGRYQIRAKAESEGYPDPSFLLSADANATFPNVVVDAHRISDVRVVLGSRGATLEGEVRDQRTGRPLGKAKITISDADHPQAYVEVFTNDSGRFHFTVPAKPLVIRATASGYNSATLDSGRRLTLSSGERRELDIELEPALAK